MGKRLITWTGGPLQYDGINANYWRLKSAEVATYPFTFHGRLRFNAVMDPPVFGPDSWKQGQTAAYEPGLNFHPHYPSNSRNTGFGIGRRANPTWVGNWTEMRDLDPEDPYQVRTGYVKRQRYDLSADPADGQWHDFKFEVASQGEYRFWWDGALVGDILEKEPFTIDPGPVPVGLRLDFLDVDLGAMYLEDESPMAHKLTDMADVLRAAGLSVVEETATSKVTGGIISWKDFGRSGNSSYANGTPNHLMIHHTASKTSIQNDVQYCNHSSLIRPLANLLISREGTVHVCAAGPTNTNGKGVDTWGGGVPENAMNAHAIGIEVCNNGVGEPYPQAQQDALMRVVRSLRNRYDIPVNNIRGHYEWAPTRKIDPSGPSRWSDGENQKWDMNSFRAEAATTTPLPPPIPEDDMKPKLIRLAGQSGTFAQWNGYKTWIPDRGSLAAFQFAHAIADSEIITLPNGDWMRASGPILGPVPTGYDGWGVKL